METILPNNSSIDSEYVSFIKDGRCLKLVAIQDFVADNCPIKKDSIGGIIDNNVRIIGKSWINESSIVKKSTIDNSLILYSSCIKSIVKYSHIHNSHCNLINIDSTRIYDSIVESSPIRNSIIHYSTARNCHVSSSRVSYDTISDITLSNINITKNNTIWFKNFWGSGRKFFYHIPTKLWYVGCFKGTGEELIKKAYRDSTEKGVMYERYVKFVNEIINENRETKTNRENQ